MALDNVKNILLILSGKGGVGKSSITTQLALSLSLAGHSVGILDIDLTGPSIPRFLGIESAKIKQAPGGWLPVEVHASQTLPHIPPPPFSPFPTESASTSTLENGHTLSESANAPPTESTAATPPLQSPPEAAPIGSLYAMSLAFLLSSRSSAIVWRGPKKTAMVRQFLSDVLWPPLDYLLIDTPPGTSDEHISVIETLLKKVHNPAHTSSSVGAQGQGEGEKEEEEQKIYPRLAGAVVVTTPQAVAVADVKKELNFCAKTGVRVVGVVENMSGYVCPCCGVSSNIFSKGGGEVMATEFGVQFLGGVPIDALWGQLVEEGARPVYRKEEGRGEEDEDENEGLDGRRMQGEEGGNTKEDIVAERPRDDALLVDKYRSCSLYPLFQIITQQVVQTVESNTAATARQANGSGLI